MDWHDPQSDPGELGDLQPADANATDLHALWAGASRFAGYRRLLDPTGERVARVMVEVAPGATATQRLALYSLIATPPVYRQQQPPPRFVTGELRISLLWLLGLPFTGVRRWRLGLPQSARFEPRMEVDFPPLGNLPITVPWVGLIDHGIAFAHRSFREPDASAATRIRLLWDQDPGRDSATPASKWRRDFQLGYGGCLSGSDIDSAIAAYPNDEARVYRSFGYTPAGHRVSHGSHVLDLAVGHPHPLAPWGAVGAAWNGCAAWAPVIAVQLPHLPDKDTSGGGLGVHVLDALHFIAARVPRMRRVVVNLSDGAYGGRHDGHSMTEQAIDDFLRTHDNVELVVAAGNAGDQKLHAARRQPLQPGDRTGVDWMVLPDDPTDSFCEVWFESALPLQPGQVDLEVTPPGDLPAVVVPLGGHRVRREAGAPHARCAVLSTVQSVNHAGQAGFLVTLGPTRSQQAGRPIVPHGRWRLEVVHRGGAAIEQVHFWVERDNPVGNDPGPRRQSFLRPYAGGGVGIERERTLGSLAGCGEAFVVAGHGMRGTWPVGPGPTPTSDVPPYVSHGPGRAAHPTRGPDVSAACEESPLLHGLLAAGNRSGSRFRMNGTSVAAPLVTRWMVEQIAAAPPAAPPPTRQQLRDLLQGLPGQRVVAGCAPAGPCPVQASPADSRRGGYQRIGNGPPNSRASGRATR